MLLPQKWLQDPFTGWELGSLFLPFFPPLLLEEHSPVNIWITSLKVLRVSLFKKNPNGAVSKLKGFEACLWILVFLVCSLKDFEI